MMKEVSIIVFRHGETLWNKEKRLQGQTNIPLNEAGKAQASELASKLKDSKLDIILSSDLIRAQETAAIVAFALDIPVIFDAGLREANLGSVEGLLRDEVIKNFGQETWDAWASVEEKDLDFSFPKGELKRDQLTRMLSCLENFIEDNQDIERLGVSTHGGSLRRLIHYCQGAPQNPVPIPNCQAYKISYSPSLRIWKYLEAL